MLITLAAIIATPAMALDPDHWMGVLRPRAANWPSGAPGSASRPFGTPTADGLRFDVGVYSEGSPNSELYGLRGIYMLPGAWGANNILDEQYREQYDELYNQYSGTLMGDLSGQTTVVYTYRLYTPDLPMGELFAITDFVASSYGEGVTNTSALNRNPVADIRMNVGFLNSKNTLDTFFSEGAADHWFVTSTGQSLIANGEWRTVTVTLDAAFFSAWNGSGTFADTIANVLYTRFDIASGYLGYGGFAWSDEGRVTDGWLEFGEATTLVLTPGDINFDGVVDIEDYNIMMANWGQTFPSSLAYAKGKLAGGNDPIGLDDYAILQAAWPDAPPPIPEPVTMSLLALGGLALLRRRK